MIYGCIPSIYVVNWIKQGQGAKILSTFKKYYVMYVPFLVSERPVWRVTNPSVSCGESTTKHCTVMVSPYNSEAVREVSI